MPDAATYDPASTPYLSLVCAIGPAQRAPKWVTQTRLFLAATVAQAEEHRLPLEIVLVDWMTETDIPASSLLGDLPYNDFAQIRVIDAPYAEMRDGAPLDRERSAQNVGIRRAKGEFVLTTGTDVILSNALFAHIARRELARSTFYFAFRFDTDALLPDGPAAGITGIEAMCRSGVYGAGPSVHRVNCNFIQGGSDADWAVAAKKAFDDSELIRCEFPLAYCQGNFALMARESWLELGGFPEWNVSDKHFDRMVMAQAHYRQWPKTLLPWDCHYFSASRLRAYNPADDIYTDQDGDLRIRVASPQIRPLNDYHVVNILIRLRTVFDQNPALLPANIHLNKPDWGLFGHDLVEQTFVASSV